MFVIYWTQMYCAVFNCVHVTFILLKWRQFMYI